MVEVRALHSLTTTYHIAYTENEQMFRAATATCRNGEAMRGELHMCTDAHTLNYISKHQISHDSYATTVSPPKFILNLLRL